VIEFDSGPTPALAEHFAKLPSYAAQRDLFWFDWGPIFYRGRLDKSARVLVIASDPGRWLVTRASACKAFCTNLG
jgi:hypothetical protein